MSSTVAIPAKAMAEIERLGTWEWKPADKFCPDVISRTWEWYLAHFGVREIHRDRVNHYCDNPWCDGHLLYYEVFYSDGSKHRIWPTRKELGYDT